MKIVMAKTAKPSLRVRYRGTIRFGSGLLLVSAVFQVLWLLILGIVGLN